MAKNESTAINDLIHLVQGKIIDHGSDGSDEPLFVTAPPARMAPTGPLPPPMPRRRAPNATPPVQLIAEYEDDDSETQVDPHALLAWGSPDSLPQPVLPQYAFPTPTPLPPAPPPPIRHDATERVELYAPVPVPVWAAPQARPAPVASTGFDVMETVRVAALPPPTEGGRFAGLARYVLPASAAAIALGCVAGFLLHHKQPASEAPAPIVMQVSPPPVAPHSQAASAALAAAMTPPIVTPIAGAASDAVASDPVAPAVVGSAIVASAVVAPAVAPAVAAPAAVAPAVAPPTVTSTGEAIGWKPTAVQPTITAKPVAPAPVAVAAVEPAPVAVAAVEPAAEPAADDADEIEMTATTVAKRHHHHGATTQRVARIAPPAPKAAVAPSPRRRSADPVAVALAEPTPQARSATKATGSGPGKVTITSTPAALIYVDGRSTNMMTPKTLPLSAGTHKITLLEIRSRKAKTAEIDVAAGGALQVAKKF